MPVKGIGTIEVLRHLEPCGQVMSISIEKPCGLEKIEEHQSVEHKRTIQLALSLPYISLDMGQKSSALSFKAMKELFRLLLVIVAYIFIAVKHLFCLLCITCESYDCF